MTSKKETVSIAGLQLTPEEIESMRQGVPLSGTLAGGIGAASTVVPSVKHQISGHAKQIRPNFAGNKPGEGLVDNVSPNFAGRLADQAKSFAKDELKRLEEADRAKESLSNQSLRRDLEALRRQIKRLEKQLKEVTDAKA